MAVETAGLELSISQVPRLRTESEVEASESKQTMAKRVGPTCD